MPVAPADAIVVLGCRVRADGSPTAFLRARVEAGVAALRAGRAPLLLLSGGRRWGRVAEWEVMRRLALELDATEADLLIEPASQTTADNAMESRRLLGPRRRVAVVTQAFHAPRALRLFCRADLLASWEPAATPPLPLWTRARLAANERVALAFDWLAR